MELRAELLDSARARGRTSRATTRATIRAARAASCERPLLGRDVARDVRLRLGAVAVRAQERGEFGENTTFIEATSGNTGIALAAAGAALGNPVKIIMPCNMSEERKQMMRAFGAEVVEVGHSDFEAAINLRDKMMVTGVDVWSPMQFENPDNVECHRETTGPEIHTQLDPNMALMGSFGPSAPHPVGDNLRNVRIAPWV